VCVCNDGMAAATSDGSYWSGGSTGEKGYFESEGFRNEKMTEAPGGCVTPLLTTYVFSVIMLFQFFWFAVTRL